MAMYIDDSLNLQHRSFPGVSKEHVKRMLVSSTGKIHINKDILCLYTIINAQRKRRSVGLPGSKVLKLFPGNVSREVQSCFGRVGDRSKCDAK